MRVVRVALATILLTALVAGTASATVEDSLEDLGGPVCQATERVDGQGSYVHFGEGPWAAVEDLTGVPAPDPSQWQVTGDEANGSGTACIHVGGGGSVSDSVSACQAAVHDLLDWLL